MKNGCIKPIIFIGLFIITLILISLIPVTRDNDKLEKIAKVIYQNQQHEWKKTDKWDDFELLTSLENESGDGLIFTWIYILDSGDTARANIELIKTKRLLRDERPSIYYNSKFSYIFKSDRDLPNLLPNKYKLDSDYIGRLSLSKEQNHIDTLGNIMFIIAPDRLYDFLTRGYYKVLARYDNYTSITFYESIADLSVNNKIESTRTAKIIFNDSSDVLILPYKATHEEWQN